MARIDLVAMKDVRKSEYDYQLVLDVPNIVAKKVARMCREEAKNVNTIAGEQRYNGLANMIERELEEQRE